MRTRITLVTALALAVALLQSCGGNGPTPAQNTVNSEVCSIAISGQIAATVPCFAIAAYDPTKNETAIGIALKSPTGSITTATIAVKVAGNFQAGTFNDANATSYGAAVVSGVQTTASMWVASPQPKLGNVAITVSGSAQLFLAPGSSSPGAPIAGTSSYAIHGTAQATLAPQMGATGTVTMTAKF